MTSAEPSSTHMEAMLGPESGSVSVSGSLWWLLLLLRCWLVVEFLTWQLHLLCICVCAWLPACCLFFFFDYLHPSSYALTVSFLSRLRPSSAINMTIYAICTSSVSLSLSMVQGGGILCWELHGWRNSCLMQHFKEECEEKRKEGKKERGWRVRGSGGRRERSLCAAHITSNKCAYKIHVRVNTV